MTLSKRDFPQILKAVFNEEEQALAVTGTLVPGGAAIPVIQENNLTPFEYDSLQITWIASGNGIGNPGTVVYLKGGQSGIIMGTMVITYDSNNNPITVTVS